MTLSKIASIASLASVFATPSSAKSYMVELTEGHIAQARDLDDGNSLLKACKNDKDQTYQKDAAGQLNIVTCGARTVIIVKPADTCMVIELFEAFNKGRMDYAETNAILDGENIDLAQFNNNVAKMNFCMKLEPKVK